MSEENKDIFIKVDNIKPVDVNEKKPKKRGRKPKLTTAPVKLDKPLPKKRGRKPKIPIVHDNNKIDIKENPNIILHLNISENDIKKKQVVPNEPNVIYHEFSKTTNPDNDNKTSIKQNLDKLNDDHINYHRYLENMIHERNDMISNNKQLFIEFSNSNKTKKWPSKTNIDCMWDCHSFNTEPFGLPIKKFNNILYMFGNFCSPECAAAYNFTMDDENIWQRYSLLNEIYSNNKAINIANSKLLLTKFGGIYNINDYRIKNLNKNFALNVMPIISYIPKLEEISYNYTNTNKVTNLQLNNNNSYNLKRESNILNKKNTLENIMNLKYI